MNHKLFFRMKTIPRKDVRATYVAYMLSENERVNTGRESMAEIGYELVDCPDKATPDGREVVEMYGCRWALRPEVHAERLTQQFEAAKKRQADPKTKEPETKSVVGTESLSAMICPRCGDSLQHTAVCPKCSAGQRGYKHRYTCVCGAIEIISQEVL